MNRIDPSTLRAVIKDLKRRIKEYQRLDRESNCMYNYDDASSYKQTIDTLIELKISYEKWLKKIRYERMEGP